MKIAVCAKYVPVVSRMGFDYENKTIIREGVPSEVNPFDLLGLVRAVELKSSPDDQVVVFSMGPPQAKEGLVLCLALGADRAVLISDRALAGSDTLATARALALALEKESPDLIICGRNSADAETGQVGPEMAELMDLPHVSQVRKLDYQADSKSVLVERVTDEGHQVIQCPLPAVVCVTEGIATRILTVSVASLVNSTVMALAFTFFHFTKKKLGEKEGYISLVVVSEQIGSQVDVFD